MPPPPLRPLRPPQIDFSAPQPVGPTSGEQSPQTSPSSAYIIDDIYDSYFDQPTYPKPQAKSPPASLNSSSLSISSGGSALRVVHVSTMMTEDPSWLVPKRRAPKPPSTRSPPLLPPLILNPPRDEVSSLPIIMQREVQRHLLLLSHENENIRINRNSRLDLHLWVSNQLGPRLTVSLSRLDSVARNHRGYDVLAAILPAVGHYLAEHIEVLVHKTVQEPPPRLATLLRSARAEGPADALRLVVDEEPFMLPLALPALKKIESNCLHIPTLRALSELYRALYAEVRRLPPGGDPRLQLDLPNRIYTLCPTPGQIAQGWLQKANDLASLCRNPNPKSPQFRNAI